MEVIDFRKVFLFETGAANPRTSNDQCHCIGQWRLVLGLVSLMCASISSPNFDPVRLRSCFGMKVITPWLAVSIARQWFSPRFWQVCLSNKSAPRQKDRSNKSKNHLKNCPKCEKKTLTILSSSISVCKLHHLNGCLSMKSSFLWFLMIPKLLSEQISSTQVLIATGLDQESGWVSEMMRKIRRWGGENTWEACSFDGSFPKSEDAVPDWFGATPTFRFWLGIRCLDNSPAEGALQRNMQ